ncbi:hypothetical protein [Natrinema halophilum]|uniref:Uncharacterized protein n=1 Tax=Natrinema halophilum TaxID=1699371 RepID=A0A7D5GM36_9EURY|nr:hypothetical protein [Natrinema halophilum]QLG48193.1 hypothetical protein HYG82_04685 [Natrinema halophilum]
MRAITGTRARLVEFARQPTTLAMLVFLPPVAIETYGTAMESFPALTGLNADPITVGRMTGTLFAVAFLAGLIGLFQVISARSGDERLALCGYPRHRLLATRLATMLAVSGIGAAIAFGIFSWRTDVAAPALAFGILVLAGLLYGLLGVLVGTLLPSDLEGSLVLVFLADLDNVLSSDLFDVGSIAEIAPLYHPHALFEAAVLEGTLDGGHLVPALSYVAVLLVAAFVAFVSVTGEEGMLA